MSTAPKDDVTSATHSFQRSFINPRRNNLDTLNFTICFLYLSLVPFWSSCVRSMTRLRYGGPEQSRCCGPMCGDDRWRNHCGEWVKLLKFLVWGYVGFFAASEQWYCLTSIRNSNTQHYKSQFSKIFVLKYRYIFFNYIRTKALAKALQILGEDAGLVEQMEYFFNSK